MNQSLDKMPLLDNTSLASLHAQPRSVRAMEAGDLQAVGRLFNKAFRNKVQEPGGDLLDYLDQVFLKPPGYSPELGSIVHENSKGQIDSALLAMPMAFDIGGRRIAARLLCAFMADGRSGLVGAAQLTRAIRLSQPDLCFSDNASPASADHWSAAGGMMLPIQSLEWQRIFRPSRAGLRELQTKLPSSRHLPLGPLLGGIDSLARRYFKAFTPPIPKGLVSQAASPDEFFAHSRKMTERFFIRPAWSRDDLAWLMETAALNRTLGSLQCRTIYDAKGEPVGCYLFFGQQGGWAHVLNILCLEDREFDVVGQMFADLDANGYAAAHGMAQPFLMNALMRQRQMSFRHRGYFCMLTRHREVNEAAIRHDIFFGGLASESWSRLLTDFR
jgi:hypothetical protein